MVNPTRPVFVMINYEGFYVSGDKDLKDGIFDDLSFPEDSLAQAALLGDYAEQVYGTDERFYDEEIGKAVKQDFVNWLTDLLESDTIAGSVGGAVEGHAIPHFHLNDYEALEVPERFAPLIKNGSFIEELCATYTGSEEVGYVDRKGLHYTGMSLVDLINDHLYEDHLIKSIEECISERHPGLWSRRDRCSTLHFLHFADGLSALNACSLLVGNPCAREKFTEEMWLSRENLGLPKWPEITGSTIGSSGVSAQNVVEYSRYPALISFGLDAVFVAAEGDFDDVYDVLWDNRDADEIEKYLGPGCHDHSFGESYKHELYERSLDYVSEARWELCQALGFSGELQRGNPNGEYSTDTVDYEINRTLGISKQYDAALPITGLWQPSELAFDSDTEVYFVDQKEFESSIPLVGFVSRYATDEEIVKAAKEFRDVHSSIPMREKFTSVTSDPWSGIDALNMLALLYDSREVAALALVDAAAKRGITVIGVEFR